MNLPDDRVREIAESPLSLARGTYVDAWYLAKEVAELRAYKERTEAALRELSERVGDHGACVACYKLLALGLWRDKEPAKLKEGP